MNKYSYISYLFVLLGAATIGLLVYSCANRAYPEGGPKDVVAPKVVAEIPESFSKNFSKKHVNIYFDEYVQLKEINEKFIISPPQKKKPKVNLRAKYVRVSFVDSLKQNTTYSLDFADAIVDNNESNPMGYYRYVFSTGNEIDTLELSGNVVYAETNEPMLNMYVFLYEKNVDSLPLLQIPDYIARTDSSGFFRVTNLKDGEYKIVAVGDNNRDYKFTPEAETVGFMDSLVHPVAMSMVRYDTITRIDKIIGKDTITSDTILTVNYIAYGPNNLYLRLFEEKPTQLYMVDDNRKERERLDFIFSIPAKNGFEIELWDTLATQPFPQDWYIKEHSVGNDTITLWMKDSLVYKKDTLGFIVKYLRTDSTGQYVLAADTNRYTFTEKKKTERKNKKKEEEVKAVAIEFLNINSNVGSEFDLGGRLTLSFDRPILEEGLRSIQLLEKVDTVYQPKKYTLVEDSLKIRQFYLETKLDAEKEYMLKADSATIYDIYGKFNNKFEKTFKMRSPEYYGKLILNVSGVTGNTVLQLYKSENSKSENGKRKFSIVAEHFVDKDGIVTFDLLHEGKYQVRAILDHNGNQKWDTGLYLKRVQPEEIRYLPVEITMKQNFDIEQEFDLQKKGDEGKVKNKK